MRHDDIIPRTPFSNGVTLKRPTLWDVLMSFSYVRQERHEARALDGLRELPLVLGANTSVLRVDHLRLARNKTAQKVNFLIIDVI